jgi:hypothetical protein
VISGRLHHDNALSHTSLVVQQFLAEKSFPVITQPLYSPDLAPSDFWLFHSEHRPQMDTFHDHGGHQIECNGLTLEDSKRSLLLVLPTMRERACVCERERARNVFTAHHITGSLAVAWLTL